MPDLRSLPRTRYGGIQFSFREIEKTGCARSLRSLRLPSVARLEFIPMEIGAGMTNLIEAAIYKRTPVRMTLAEKICLSGWLRGSREASMWRSI